MSEQKFGKRSCSKLKDNIVKQTGKENTYGNQSKTLNGLILLQKNERRQHMDTPITRAEHEEFRRRMEGTRE